MEIVSHKGDITELEVDAIVNAANSDLWMGAGVAGAIKRKGGDSIEKEAMEQGPVRPGEAVITSAGNLPAKYVIHAAGMPPGGRATVVNVEFSVKHAMNLASQNGVQSIAFPAIGAGVGGLSTEESIRAILEGIESQEEDLSVQRVFLVGYSDNAYKIIERIIKS
ncbi:macro domain-containing protein [Candidatus Thorarchaeota archaeon]|nr:MAG: macro domain-containing protein [Candidatus Thorarchaeota archaeon]